MIRDLLSGLRRRKEQTAATGKAAPQQTVFLIDDQPESLSAISQALANEAYRLETAATAESVVKKLSACHPDLILLDSRVAAEDGTRLARRLLANEDLAVVPIVALTKMEAGAHAAPEPAGQYDGHIEKPIGAGALPIQVRTFLESSRQEPAPAEGFTFAATSTLDHVRETAKLLHAIEAGLPDSQFAPASRTSLQRLSEMVGGPQNQDLAGYLRRAERVSHATTVRARSRFRSMIRLCRELVEREPDAAPGFADMRANYLDHRTAELITLERALENRDYPVLRSAGHNMKGTGAAYGFAELTDIGRQLESAAKAGNAAAVEAQLDQIEAYISIVMPSSALRGVDTARP